LDIHAERTVLLAAIPCAEPNSHRLLDAWEETELGDIELRVKTTETIVEASMSGEWRRWDRVMLHPEYAGSGGGANGKDPFTGSVTSVLVAVRFRMKTI